MGRRYSSRRQTEKGRPIERKGERCEGKERKMERCEWRGKTLDQSRGIVFQCNTCDS